jgi:hypothetical protein
MYKSSAMLACSFCSSHKQTVSPSCDHAQEPDTHAYAVYSTRCNAMQRQTSVLHGIERLWMQSENACSHSLAASFSSRFGCLTSSSSHLVSRLIHTLKHGKIEQRLQLGVGHAGSNTKVVDEVKRSLFCLG